MMEIDQLIDRLREGLGVYQDYKYCEECGASQPNPSQHAAHLLETLSELEKRIEAHG